MSHTIESSGAIRAVRFGPFEGDLQSGELRKRGLKLKLEGSATRRISRLIAST